MNQLPATRAEIDALADSIAELDAQETLLGHARLTHVRRFDAVAGWGVQGARSCAHWLSWRLGKDLQTAREQVRVARALGELPLVDAAFKRGELSYSKVRAITRVATPENEAALVELALHSTAEQLVKICRGYSQVMTGTGDEELAPRDERRIFERRDLPSGLVRFTVQVRPEEAAVVLQALEVTVKRTITENVTVKRTMRQNSSADEGGASAELPPPIEAPQRVDAFVSICESFLAAADTTEPPGETPSVPGRHEVVVHVDAASGTGELPDGSMLGPETVRRLCCDSPITTVIERPDGEGLQAGRRSRAVSTRLRRALEARDEHCRFPGCGNRYWLDAHHIEHWADGGPTTLENLSLLCRRHHRLVHEGGFRMEQTADGPVFFDPHGRKIERAPRLPDLGADALEALDEARRAEEIGPWTNAPRWDGSRLDLGAAVDGLVRVGAREPVTFAEDPSFDD